MVDDGSVPAEAGGKARIVGGGDSYGTWTLYDTANALIFTAPSTFNEMQFVANVHIGRMEVVVIEEVPPDAQLRLQIAPPGGAFTNIALVDVDHIYAPMINHALPEPHAVTAEEEASGTFSIDHVVLPLPGNKVVMPGNDMAAVYTSLLAQHGLAPDCFRHHVKEISMPGAYRRIVQRPADLTWEFFRYSDPTDPLAQTDLAALRNEPLPQGDATGSMRAVVLSFMLPSSTYATMLLRELTKQSTALTHQKELNLYQAPQLAAGQTTGRSEA